MPVRTRSTTHHSRPTQRAQSPKPVPLLALLQSKLSLIIITLLCLLGLWSLRISQEQADISKDSLNKLQQEVAQLELELTQAEQATASKQSQLAREKIIRNELLGQQEGEIILQVPEKEDWPVPVEGETKNTPLEEWKRLVF